jgi:iron complex outermembrane recepter protein
MMTMTSIKIARLGALAAFFTTLLAQASPVDAQAPDPLRITVPPVVVTAQKEPADPQKLPVSVTTVGKDTLVGENLTSISDAGLFAPNTFFSDFQARKLSFPHFRGISSGPGNPAITTYIDGVPMIHTNASSVELLDVEQVEFVRGGQSALFGRNALGGIVNIASTRPSLNQWTGSGSVPLGNYDSREFRGNVSGPLSANSAISIAAGRSVRDGFTTNDLYGTDIDSRGNTFGKAQLLWTPATNWETRFIVGGERARDGDYALTDLNSLQTNPFHTQRDFVGSTDRDLVSGTFLTRYAGTRFTFSTITGVVDWRTKDETDLDYSPLPLLIRNNAEDATQFTQEVRLASRVEAPLRLSDTMALRWQAGVFFFTQDYDQDAVNTYSPFVFPPRVPTVVEHHSPTAALDDSGIGIYGQATFTLRERTDLAIGARFDHESKNAVLDTFLVPALFPPARVDGDRSFSNASPQASVAYRVRPDRMVYASIGSGYKAGGFNPASPPGAEAFDEEHTWQVEGGVKTSWAGGRVIANAALFYIDWDDLQLNLPNPEVPAQFYVANVGSARSAGFEAELTGRAAEGFEIFGVLGVTNGRFKDGSSSSGVDVSGNDLPSTPGYTATIGARYRHDVAEKMAVYGRGEVALIGSYQYDDANTAGQDAYSLTNLRAGVQWGSIFAEAWIRNAFDTRYIPIAFAYPGLAPSGFVGEIGRPRTYGINLGVQF